MMDAILSWLSVSFSAAAMVLLIILLFLKTSYKSAIKGAEQTVREEFRSNRDESSRAARDLREEVTVHGFKGSEVQRLYSHHHASFCNPFVWEN